jgi:hypothetical protein
MVITAVNHDIPAFQPVTDADNCADTNYISKDEYITHWLRSPYPAVFKSAHTMVGGGGNSSSVGAAPGLPAHAATTDDSDSDAPSILFNRKA